MIKLAAVNEESELLPTSIEINLARVLHWQLTMHNNNEMNFIIIHKVLSTYESSKLKMDGAKRRKAQARNFEYRMVPSY